VNPSPLVQLSQLEGMARFQHEAMATTFVFHLAPAPDLELRAVAEEAFRLVDKIEDLLSFYREGSDVTRINRAAPGETVRINELTHQCLLTALEISAASQNAFNPFAGGSAVSAKKQSIPAHLKDLPPLDPNDRATVLSIDPAHPQITKLDGNRWLDLGAIGKGAALDAVAELLHEWEIPRAVLVSGGSSVLVFGRPQGSDQDQWPLTIPLDPAPLNINVPTPFALGSSGLGFQPGHVISAGDTHIRPQSVVVAPSAAVADALSTAALLLADKPLRDLMGDDPSFSVLATQTNGPAVQTGLFSSLKLSQIQATIVIPCWCESQRLPAFLAELVAVVSHSPHLIEIIVVDDGSPAPEPDQTAKIISSLRRQNSFLQPLLQPAHQGKGGAVYHGWRAASETSQWLVFVDADGAVPAREVIRGLERVLDSETAPVLVAASRYHSDSSHPVARGLIRQRTGAWFAQWARRQLHIAAEDSQCGFKIVPAAWWRQRDAWCELGYAFDLELLIAARDDDLAVENLPISWQEVGGSNVSWRDGMNLVDTVKRLRNS